MFGPCNNTIGQMFINPNPTPGIEPDQYYIDMGRPMTEAEAIAARGHLVRETSPGSGNYVMYSMIDSILARSIFEEEKTERGQRAIARVIFNRFLTLKEVTTDEEFASLTAVANIDRYGEDLNAEPAIDFYEDLYKWVIYARENGGTGDWQFHGLDNPASLDPYSRNEIDAWQRACDLAYCLTNFIDFDPIITNGQVRFVGYHDDLQEANPADPEDWIVKNKMKNFFNVQAAGESGFGNHEYYRDNLLGTKAIRDYCWDPPYTGDQIINKTRIPTQNASDFVDFLVSRVGCGYAYGSYGQMCTNDLIDRLKTKSPSQAANLEISRSKWMGRYVSDCSGLIKWFLLIQGVVNCDTNADGMYRDWCGYVGTTTNMPAVLPKPGGVVVFRLSKGKATHIGVHIGYNKIIEAKGCNEGVVVTQYDPNYWHAYGYLDWIGDSLDPTQIPDLALVADASTIPSNLGPDEGVSGIQSYNTPTVIYREGDSGPEIEMIRRRLWAEDNSVVVSDYFDAILTQKIKAFQTSKGITSDGLVGSGTWRKLFPILQKRVGQQDGALAMQALLNYQGYLVGTPDGLFGTGTETVLKAYQGDHELDQDGICGDKTWRSLTLSPPEEEQIIVPGGPMAAKCQLGDTGAVVTQAQNRLSMWRFNFSTPGTYDEYTKNLVEEFQDIHGITVDGIVGNATWSKMFPLLKKAYGVRDNVDVLQRALVHQRHIVTVDGMFGSGCEAAVIAYQTMRGLTADGIVGETTWASLFIQEPTGEAQYFGSGGSGSGSSTIYRYGNVNSAIRQVKRRMAAESLFSGTIDTTYDSILLTAIRNFQYSRGATVDGLIGPVTWSLLFPVVKKKTGQQDGAKAVQTLLNMNGYNVGTPDGLFGTGSETKLKEFQTANGLTADGICGANTWEKLCLI